MSNYGAGSIGSGNTTIVNNYNINNGVEGSNNNVGTGNNSQGPNAQAYSGMGQCQQDPMSMMQMLMQMMQMMNPKAMKGKG
jgi:hypothetical protein